mgnify:CR=1 FL=1
MKNIKLRIVYLILCSALLLFALFMLAVNLIIPAHFVREAKKALISEAEYQNRTIPYTDDESFFDDGWNDTEEHFLTPNIVFLELLRRDYRVYIGKVGETEVDFVAEKPNDKVYIQVTESMQSPETRERELRPLRMIGDNYEKIILSMDRSFINSYEGIKSLNLIDWLLAE